MKKGKTHYTLPAQSFLIHNLNADVQELLPDSHILFIYLFYLKRSIIVNGYSSICRIVDDIKLVPDFIINFINGFYHLVIALSSFSHIFDSFFNLFTTRQFTCEKINAIKLVSKNGNQDTGDKSNYPPEVSNFRK